MNLNRRKKLLMFSLAAETFLISYGLLLGLQTSLVTILYLISGLIFIAAVLIMPPARFPIRKDFKKDYFIKGPLLLIMLLLGYITASYWLDMVPMDPDYADMLPVIKVMNERFLHGDWKHVYDIIPEIWNGTRPIYLPAMWLPYALAVAHYVDMRWVTVILVLASFVVILTGIRIKKNGYYGYGLIAVTALLFWWIFARNDIHGLISLTEEGVVIFYFVLLTVAIIYGNPFFIGIAASLCLLSRYSMIGWLIPYLIFLIFRKEYRKVIIFSLTGVVCILLLFLIPFGYNVLLQMLALPGNYIAFARRVWTDSPEVFWLNVGLAKFFGPRRVAILHGTLMTMTFLIPVFFMWFCLGQKKWKFQNINLACFKLSLLVFYQLIDVPYGYLFYTCTFVSLIIATSLLTSSSGEFLPNLE
jgi:hypothetical protein